MSDIVFNVHIDEDYDRLNKRLESLQQQLAEAKECGERFEVKWAAAFDSNEEFARNVRELRVLIENQKLQIKELLFFDNWKEDHVLTTNLKKMLADLSSVPSNLPRFVPEEKVKILTDALWQMSDGSLIAKNALYDFYLDQAEKEGV